MSYLFSTSFRTVGDFLAVNQGTSNIDVLIAATAGVVGTVAGAAITVLGTRVSARAENLRQDRQLASESLKLREAYREELERQVRETAVGLSDAWASVIRANDRYGSPAAGSSEVADDARDRMVEALTLLGSKLNALLVLPISESLETDVFAVDSAVDSLRLSLDDPSKMIRFRDAVSPAIHKLLEPSERATLFGLRFLIQSLNSSCRLCYDEMRARNHRRLICASPNEAPWGAHGRGSEA
jgi:hypothetical protein